MKAVAKGQRPTDRAGLAGRPRAFRRGERRDGRGRESGRGPVTRPLLFRVEYDAQQPVVGCMASRTPPFKVMGQPPDYRRGKAERGLETTDVNGRADLPPPLLRTTTRSSPIATVAHWDDDGGLTVYETCQGGVHLIRMGLAEALGIPMRKAGLDPCRLEVPRRRFRRQEFHVAQNILPAIAARQLGRPVKLELTRAQMYTSCGYRSETLQRSSARGKFSRDAHLDRAREHLDRIRHGEFPEPCAQITQMLVCLPERHDHAPPGPPERRGPDLHPCAW